MYSQTSYNETPSLFKIAAKFPLKLTILPVNQHYYEKKTLNKKSQTIWMLHSLTLIYLRTIICDLELQNISKMAAIITLTLSILPVNQHYYGQKKHN